MEVVTYQVFVSSTFRDLVEERQAVLDAILQLGHHPSGMEVFPAASTTPWELIKKILAECDYYILIIGGRYGTTDEAGISYTELEYNLAQELGIPTLVFVHGKPELIPAGKIEMDAVAQAKLADFKAKVGKHHRKEWSSPDELKANVVLGLSYEMKVNPRTGWVRGDQRDSSETLKKLTDLMEKNAALEAELALFHQNGLSEQSLGEKTLSMGDEVVKVRCTVEGQLVEVEFTWNELFAAVSSALVLGQQEREVLYALVSTVAAKIMLSKTGKPKIEVDNDDLSKICFQFVALEYWEAIEIAGHTTDTRYSQSKQEWIHNKIPAQFPGYRLTKLGIRRLAHLKAVRKPAA